MEVFIRIYTDGSRMQMEKKEEKNNAKFILIPSKEIDKLFLENYNAETNFSLSFVLFKFEGRERGRERELEGF